jgi:hypothetical protein
MMTKEELTRIVREQLEWCEVLHQIVPGANVREAISDMKPCVYVTSGTPLTKSSPPPHRYLHVVSNKRVDGPAYAEVLKDESARWNAMTEAERLAAAEARIGDKWSKEKVVERLTKKGFFGN